MKKLTSLLLSAMMFLSALPCGTAESGIAGGSSNENAVMEVQDSESDSIPNEADESGITAAQTNSGSGASSGTSADYKISGSIILPDGYVDDGEMKRATLYFDSEAGCEEYQYLKFTGGDYSFEFSVPSSLIKGSYYVSVFPNNFGGNILRQRCYYTKNGEPVKVDISEGASDLNIELESGYIISGELVVPDDVEIGKVDEAYFGVMAWYNEDHSFNSGVVDENGEGNFSSWLDLKPENGVKSIPFSVAVPKNSKITLGAKGQIYADSGEVYPYSSYVYYAGGGHSTIDPVDAYTITVDKDISGIKFPLIYGNLAEVTTKAPEGLTGEAVGDAVITSEYDLPIDSTFFSLYSGKSDTTSIVIPKGYDKGYVYYLLDYHERWGTTMPDLQEGIVYVNPDGTYSLKKEDAQLWDFNNLNDDNFVDISFTVAKKSNFGGESDGNTKFTFVDSTYTGGKAIPSATLVLQKDGEDAQTVLTADGSGIIKTDLDNGTYSVQAYADDYRPRSFIIEKTDNNNEFTVYMNKYDLVNLDTTAKEMTLDDIINAGIDPKSLDNEHIYDFTTILEFIPGEYVELNYVCDGDKVIKSEPKHFDNAVIYPAAKDIFLIIHSNVTWLKEMFDVQLIAQNTSAAESIENAAAILYLPDGLSLAKMKENKVQIPNISMGTLLPYSQKDVHWYLCGDKAGKYTLTGMFSGNRVGGGISEKLQQNFSTKEPITVLGGDAMKLTIEAEKKAEAGKPYKVNFMLQNVSDKTLYNVALNIHGGKFVNEYSVENLLFEAETGKPLTGSLDGGFSTSTEKFEPGQTLSGTFTITFGKGIDTEDNIRYMLSNMFVVSGAGSTAEIPTEINLKDAVEKHNWDSGAVTKLPTCTEKGERLYTCTGCGATRTEEIPANGHSMSEIILRTAPTCTQDGYASSKCQRPGCTYEITEKRYARGHAWETEFTVDKEPTCTVDGEKSHHCSHCDERKDITAIPASHKMGEWVETKPATCTEKGEKTSKCANCEYEEKQDILPLGHDWDETVTVDKAPTCTSDGSQSIHCKVCDAKNNITPIPATGHNFGEAVVIKKATCTEPGETARRCLNEGCSETESKYPEALGHDWDSGKFIKEPTETEDGTIRYTCNRCSATEDKPLPKQSKQKIEFARPGDIVITYGEFENVNNDAYNDSENGGALTYTCSNESVASVNDKGRVKINGAGEAIITVTAAKTDLYAETSASYKLTVKKAPLTIKPKDAEITYGENAEIKEYTAEGFVLYENESVLSGEAVYGTNYVQYADAGQYELTVSGFTAANYEITFAKGVLTVKKAKDYSLSLENLVQRAGKTSPVTVIITPKDSTAVIKTEYKAENGEWSETVPSEIGTYSVRAALISSANIEVNSAKLAEGILEIKVGAMINLDGDESIGLKTDVNENEAEFSIADEDLKKLLDNIPSTGEVVIDAKGSTEGVNEIILPSNIIDALDKNEKAKTLTVLADDAEISMSSDVMKTVADKLNPEDKVSIHIESVDKESMNEKQQKALDSIGGDNAVILQLNLVVAHYDGDGNQTGEDIHELNGNVDVRAAYTLPENMEGKKILVCYVANDGSVSYVRAKFENGFVSFKTNHFSHYALVAAVCHHVWDKGTVTKAATKNETGIKQFECTLCGEIKEEIIPKITVTIDGGDNKGNGGSSGGSSFYPTFTPTKQNNEQSNTEEWKNPFTDVSENDWFMSDVEYAAKNNLMSGTGDTTFEPHALLNRAMLVTVLWRAEGKPQINYIMPFDDVDENGYYAEAVRWAAGENIVNGISENEFAPDSNITREQIASIIYRYAKYKGYDLSAAENADTAAYSDINDVSEYAVTAIRYALGTGVINGKTEVAINPKDNATRAETAAILRRFIESHK